jgi:WD40 repeat protein
MIRCAVACLLMAKILTHDAVAADPPSVRCVAFSPDGTLLAAAGAESEATGQLTVWETVTYQTRWRYSEPVGFPRVAFSPDGTQMALSRFAPETKLLDAASGEVTGVLKGHVNHARCVAYSRDRKWIVTGSYDRTIMIWDAESQTSVAKIEGHNAPVYHVAFSPDGKLLASADSNASKAYLWDLQAGKQLHMFDNLGSLVPHVSFAPDGNLLAVSSWTGGLRLYDTHSYKLLEQIEGVGGVHAAEFSPDGRWLAVAGSGSRVYVFRVDTTADAASLERINGLIATWEDDSYEARERASRELGTSGRSAAKQLRSALDSSSPETRIRARRLLQSFASAESAIQLQGHHGALECVTFAPDSKLLASGDKLGKVNVWRVEDWQQVATLSLSVAP